MKPALLFAVIFAALIGTIALTDVDAGIDYRLPQGVVPSAYKMFLITEFVDFTFTGVSEIDITVKESNTRIIILHAKELEITSAAVITKDQRISAESVIDIKTDFLNLTLDDEISAGDYVLRLEYKGRLNDEVKGFYHSSYTDEEGNEVLFAATYFIPNHARSAFPCWDEPGFKATFDISIKHPGNYKALSNAVEISRETDETDGTQVVTKFEKTPRISSYLIAFSVSEFESLSDGTLSVWGRKSAVKNGKFAIKFANHVWKELEDIIGITQEEIGMQKMDFVVLPNFENMAMENWGLIMTSESSLLIEERDTTTASEQAVAILVGNQLAHHLFGNLVTQVWWKYLWLSEGLSAYFQYAVTREFFTEKLRDKLIIDQNLAFSIDSSSSAHPLNVEVNSPEEISAIFDGIPSLKGSSIIRMIRHILGEEAFLTALRSYLNKMGGRAATSTDLFEEFAAVFTGRSDLISVLNHWANTPGHPVVTVVRDYAAGSASLTQERFLDPPDEAHEKFYFVPITYATQGKKDFDDTTVTNWLNNDKEPTVIDGGFAEDEWIIFNKQMSGYYRVNYDDDNWRLITKYLKTENYADIHVSNRAQLVDDAMNLAKIGKLDYSIALDLLGYLKNEVDPIPWFSAVTALSDLRKKLINTEQYDNFKSYSVRLLENFLEHIAYENSPEDGWVMIYVRAEAIKLACRLGSETCRKTDSKNWVDEHEAEGVMETEIDTWINNREQEFVEFFETAVINSI